jgi:hypothetical protein
MSVSTKEPVKARATPGARSGAVPRPGTARTNAVWEQLATRCSPSGLQRKLAVSAPGDPCEREADRMADQAMRTPEPRVPRKCAACAVGVGLSPECDEEKLQRQARGVTSPAAVPNDFSAHLGLGRPLEPEVRAFFEPRFGRDFSHVRVHSGAAAEQSAREINAHAYAAAQNIVFGAGQYQPGTPEGRGLIAHELVHVVQQSAFDGIAVQRKVVDDNAHLPCRAVAGRSAADLTARENEAATLAENAAAAVRASPLAEPTRALVWKRFRFDYNDALVRCRFLPEIGDRFARIAREIRGTECTYNCTAQGEPDALCSGAIAVTDVGIFGGQRIHLCSRFWTIGPDQQAVTLLHEWAHYVFSTRGLNDELPGGFDTAECYNAFASELAGQPITGPEDANCVPNTRPLPALDRGRLRLNCPSNVFLNLSAIGGYAYGLGSHHYGTFGFGLDYLFPLTRMHDWELGLGARYLRFAPADPNDRGAYLFGVRAALASRYRPWRFGSQFGGYIEGGGINVPVGASGDRTLPYASAGLSGGVNLRIGRQMALQILAEVGGGVGFDLQNDQRLGWFQSGLSVVFQFH